LDGDDDEEREVQETNVSKVVIHSDYELFDLRNDIALLVLQSTLHPQPNINTICLRKSGTTLDETTCFASGWGNVKNSKLTIKKQNWQ